MVKILQAGFLSLFLALALFIWDVHVGMPQAAAVLLAVCGATLIFSCMIAGTLKYLASGYVMRQMANGLVDALAVYNIKIEAEREAGQQGDVVGFRFSFLSKDSPIQQVKIISAIKATYYVRRLGAGHTSIKQFKQYLIENGKPPGFYDTRFKIPSQQA